MAAMSDGNWLTNDRVIDNYFNPINYIVTYFLMHI